MANEVKNNFETIEQDILEKEKSKYQRYNVLEKN